MSLFGDVSSIFCTADLGIFVAMSCFIFLQLLGDVFVSMLSLSESLFWSLGLICLFYVINMFSESVWLSLEAGPAVWTRSGLAQHATR